MAKTINVTLLASLYASIIIEGGSALVPTNLVGPTKEYLRDIHQTPEMGAICTNELGDLIGRYIYIATEY